MLHSLWQAALLLILYVIVSKSVLLKKSPLEKRNFLFLVISSQLLLFVLTFCIYFFGDTAVHAIETYNVATVKLLSPESTYSITPWIWGAYVFIIAYKLIKTIYTWHHFRQQYQTGLQKPSVDLKLFTRLKSYQFGIKRKVTLWFSNHINTPVTFGFFKPVILLPVTLVNNITTQQAESLILHELTHIKSNDYLLNWYLIVAETFFFFNPFIISICRKVRLEREKYCDRNVIAFDYCPTLYAETLLYAERIKQQFIPSFQLAAISKKKQLLERIQFFTTPINFKQQKRIHFIVPLFGLGLILMLFTSITWRSSIFSTSASEIETAIASNFQEINNETIIPAIVNNILPVNKKTDINTLAATIEKQKPSIEKQLKKMEPLLKSIEEEAIKLSEKIQENFVTPVAFTESENSRQIIVREEQSGSKTTSIKVYRVILENGQWIVKPEWMMAAKEVAADSYFKIQFDSTAEIYPLQQ